LTPARLQRTWYEGQPPGLLLRGLEQLYKQLRAFDRRRQSRAQPDDLRGRPIIVIGNLTVGGTGKTPLLLRLCELLKQAGLRPGVISRGHGRKSRHAVDVRAASSAADTGDEPLVIARRSCLPVRVDTDRGAGARHLFAGGVEVVLADDGLQRQRLPRRLEICVVDARRGFGNGHQLPAGPLRDPLERLSEVDWVVVNGDDALPGLPEDAVRMRLRPGVFRSLDGLQQRTVEEMAAHLVAQPGHALAGIGDPPRFFRLLRDLGCKPGSEQAFPDHHAFSEQDFKGRQGSLLMTEKDAVKCTGLGLADAWYLPVEAELPAAFEQDFLARARAMLGGA